MKLKKLLFDTTSEHKASLGLLVLRITFGLTMVFSHGYPKMMKYSAMSEKFYDPFGIGSAASLILVIFAEVFCSILLALGLFTRGVLIPLLICMLVAVWMKHGGDPFGRKEMGLLYTFAYVALMITGPGKYSLDTRITEKV